MFRRAITFASGVRVRDTSRYIRIYVYKYSESSFLPEKEPITRRMIGIARRANREMVLALSGVGYCNAALSPPSFVSSRFAPFPVLSRSTRPAAEPPSSYLPPVSPPTTTIARALPFYAILHLFPATCGLAFLSKCHLVDD